MLQNNPNLKKEEDLVIGYIVAFEDGRPDKFGHFPLKQSETSPAGIFEEILKVEPSTRYSSYIFGNIRQARLASSCLDTIEFKKDEIASLLKNLVRPGIIKLL